MKKPGQKSVLLGLFLIFASETYAQNWTRVEIQLDEKLNLGSAIYEQPLDAQLPSLVNFWATWCAPCVKEIPDLIAAAQAMPEQVVLVNVGESREAIDAFAQRYPELGLGNAAVVTQGFEFKNLSEWKIRGLPTSFLMRDGVALWQAEGILPWADPAVQADIRARLQP